MKPYYIILLSIIVWLMPLFKQRGTDFFYFFLVLALFDPINFILHKLNLFHGQQTIIVAEFLAIYSLMKRTTVNNIIILTACSTVLQFFPSFSVDAEYLLKAVLQTVILLLIIYKFVIFVESKGEVSIFYIILLCYQFSVVLKVLAAVFDIRYGITQFYLIMSIQMGFGALFTIFNVNSKNFRLFKETDNF